MTRLIFTGAQGTGKTTILNHFKENGVPVITEVVRKLAKEGININEQGDLQGQRTIFNAYLDLLSKDRDYISDRGLTDVIAYTCYLAEDGHVPATAVDKQMEALRQFVEENPDIVYFYFPIEFAVVDDGVRSTNENFRTKIDQYIKHILEAVGVPYIVVHGTVEERIKMVEDTITLIENGIIRL